MTDRDCASLQVTLLAVAKRLREAPAVAQDQADASGQTFDAFRAGYLASVVQGVAEELESLSKEYLDRFAKRANRGKK